MAHTNNDTTRGSPPTASSEQKPGGCHNQPAERSSDQTHHVVDGSARSESHSEATEALWQYLRRIESGLDQIDARIDRLYVALGGGTVLLATIGLVSAFIVRGG